MELVPREQRGEELSKMSMMTLMLRKPRDSLSSSDSVDYSNYFLFVHFLTNNTKPSDHVKEVVAVH